MSEKRSTDTFKKLEFSIFLLTEEMMGIRLFPYKETFEL
jgi:hypothetical protein